MPWPPKQPARDEVAPEDVVAFDRVLDRRRRFAPDVDPEQDGGYYGRLLGSPRLAALLSEIGQLLRTCGEREDSYTHRDREFVDQVLSCDLATNVVQALHVPDALAVGVRPEAIQALRTGQEDALTDEERQLATFVRAVIAGTVTAEIWNGLERRMGRRGVLEYAVFVLYLQLTIRLQQAVGMPDPPDSTIDELLEALTRGARAVPDYRARIQ